MVIILDSLCLSLRALGWFVRVSVVVMSVSRARAMNWRVLCSERGPRRDSLGCMACSEWSDVSSAACAIASVSERQRER